MVASLTDPADEARADQRRSAAVVRDNVPKGTTRLDGLGSVRSMLRDASTRQAGFKAEIIERFGRADRAPILYLSGPAHRRQRSAVARFFAPRVIATRYRTLIQAVSGGEIARLTEDRQGQLDTMALSVAVTVAADIVGLTESNHRGMARRLDAFFAIPQRTGLFASAIGFLLGRVRMSRFYMADVRPAVAARRQTPRDDVISHLIAEGYTDAQILTECFTYGAAGMVTTREFITMAGWHLLEDDALKGHFLSQDEAGQIAILEEILRLEPVVGMLYRRTTDDGRRFALDIRAANTDETVMGACPHMLQHPRARADRVAGPGLSFGDGEHRCPGEGVAMLEATIFLNGLLRVPGLRLSKAPKVTWNPLIAGYELRGCEVRC